MYRDRMLKKDSRVKVLVLEGQPEGYLPSDQHELASTKTLVLVPYAPERYFKLDLFDHEFEVVQGDYKEREDVDTTYSIPEPIRLGDKPADMTPYDWLVELYHREKRYALRKYPYAKTSYERGLYDTALKKQQADMFERFKEDIKIAYSLTGPLAAYADAVFGYAMYIAESDRLNSDFEVDVMSETLDTFDTLHNFTNGYTLVPSGD